MNQQWRNPNTCGDFSRAPPQDMFRASIYTYKRVVCVCLLVCVNVVLIVNEQCVLTDISKYIAAVNIDNSSRAKHKDMVHLLPYNNTLSHITTPYTYM